MARKSMLLIILVALSLVAAHLQLGDFASTLGFFDGH